ncbi:ABC transporter ATP-binding protein/permease [Acinetobacter baumannii]|uniref:ABC transporter ATP-binding protein n=1 Tax=Acinetobacter baumannii TaxID=470 RepID=UPI001CDB96FC|nr:ABC transporter ATP-binding protein [Acinetobacter baumannii]MCA4303862.1 ABC transporter ATP-binding protein/permease [Acinetobacter baumannii]
MNYLKKTNLYILSQFVLSYIFNNNDKKIVFNFFTYIFIILLSSLATVLAPLALKYSIDSFSSGAKNAILVTSILLSLYVISQSASRYLIDLQWTFFCKIEQTIHSLIRNESISHIINLPVKYLHNYTSGKLVQSISNGTRSVTIYLQSFIQVGLLIIFQVVGTSIVILSFYDISFLLIILFGIALYIYYFVQGNNKILVSNRDVVEDQNTVNSDLNSAFLYPEPNKYLSVEKAYIEIMRKKNEKVKKSYIAYFNTTISVNFVTTIIFTILLGLITYLSYSKLLQGKMTIGDFVLMITYLLQLIKPVEAVGGVMRQVNQGRVFLDNYKKINSLSTEQEIWKGKKNIEKSQVNININSLNFIYPNNKHTALDNINCSFESNTVTAIIGRTGSGKSSLVKLLYGFYDDYEGEIKFNNIDIRSLSLKSLRNNISVISQECHIFNLPIWKNITIGTDRSKDEAIEVAKKFKIHEFISKLDKSYDTVVGEHGVKISGGERQRISLARAFLRNSPVIIFDEPTSSLDSVTEKEIMDLLFDKFKNSTIIIIAHRLNTIRNVDKVIVLDEGRIIETGKYGDLIYTNNNLKDLMKEID